ncbi:apoptosis-enhancing nuclease [Lasius niger]|uniref:Apoptosis-enhancing nuclease n=1 Tax=Lasius niger TaxID=67767 RepID=A0A0J7KDE3_LASNI|nr:apoptosis-enhancing nuclease [Lasius niger]
MSAIVNNLGATTGDSPAKMLVDEVDESSGRRKRPSGTARRKMKKARVAEGEGFKEPPSTPGIAPKSDSGTAKRQRPEKETPPEVAVKRPRSQGGPPGSYATAVADLAKIAILHDSRAQDVTEEQTTQIQEGIVGLVDGIPEGDFVPRFHETYRTKGVLKIICADTQSEG